ncbi:MAG: DUF1573 domain-containing protein [Chitinophagales bacterium]
MDKNNYKIVLLTVLTLSVFTIAIIELTGVSANSFSTLWRSKDRHDKNIENTAQPVNRCDIAAKMPKTTMQFYETKFSFGSVSAGKKVSHTFRYKNTGSNPLMVCKADVTCGCTVPKIQDDAVAPGADGELTVEFNTAGKSGFQQKNIIVHSNATPEAVSISIEADVH